jgi:hypothetical protein
VLAWQEKLIIDLKEEIRLLKLENLMLRSRTPGCQEQRQLDCRDSYEISDCGLYVTDFVEHPEATGGFDPDGEYEQQTSVSPLARALLSGRHRPEDVRMMVQQVQYASYGDNHHNNNELEGERVAANTLRLRASEKAAMGAGLSGMFVRRIEIDIDGVLLTV